MTVENSHVQVPAYTSKHSVWKTNTGSHKFQTSLDCIARPLKNKVTTKEHTCLTLEKVFLFTLKPKPNLKFYV